MVVAELFRWNPSADEPAEVMLCSRRGSACPPLFWTSSVYFAASYGYSAADGPACHHAHRCSGRKASSCHATMVQRRDGPPTISDVLQGAKNCHGLGSVAAGGPACEFQSPRSCFVTTIRMSYMVLCWCRVGMRRKHHPCPRGDVSSSGQKALQRRRRQRRWGRRRR